jgi:RNA polymerase sigma-70 factor (ECF subfamily)
MSITYGGSGGGVDELLVDRAREGDVAAFTQLLRECDDAMRAVVWSVVQDAWLMDDVLQNAYEKAFRSLPKFRGDSTFKTWLYRICWTTAVDAVRSQQRHRHADVSVLEERASVGSVVGSGDTGMIASIDLRRAWDRLPADQRSALALVAVEGLSHEEAAAVCGTRPGTIASRVSRARAALREQLQLEGGRR